MENEKRFPVVLKISGPFLDEIAEEEMGSYEDNGCPEPGTVPGYAAQGDLEPVEHVYNILTRHRAKLEIRDAREARLILRHVLDNSIDKARGVVGEYYPGLPDAMKALSWLRNLTRLQARIARAVPAVAPAPPTLEPWECDECGCCHCGGGCDGEHNCFAAGCECTRVCPRCDGSTGFGATDCSDSACQADRLEREARDAGA